MSEAEKLNKIKIMSGETDEDILRVFLDVAGKKIIAKAYPYSSDVTEVPAKYELLQCEIAVYLLNKRGAEGQTSHSENGISRQYENGDVPESMLKSVIPFCGVI